MASAEDEKTLVEIVEACSGPLDISRYMTFVRDPGCGAIATFEGTTRDTFEGRRVLELRYEAYTPMALRCLRDMCAAARSRWTLDRLAVAHRLGRVGVGEASVFVASSSVHRVDALAACEFLIDEIKASVPIWKKEVYENGEIWKENREFLDRRLGADDTEAKTRKKTGCCGHKEKLPEEDQGTERHP